MLDAKHMESALFFSVRHLHVNVCALEREDLVKREMGGGAPLLDAHDLRYPLPMPLVVLNRVGTLLHRGEQLGQNPAKGNNSIILIANKIDYLVTQIHCAEK